MEATGAASDAMPTLMPEQNLKPSHGITMDILPMDTTILARDQLMLRLRASHTTTHIIHIMLDTTILAKDQLMPNLKASHGTGMVDMVVMEDTTGVRTTKNNETNLS